MKAFLYNYRQSPRKVRLVANLIKGKNAEVALTELNFLAKRSGLPLRKMLQEAIANAKNMGVDKEHLFVKEFTVDKGVTLRRMMPAAMGSGHRINKRTSNLALILAERVAKVKKTKAVKEKKEKADKNEEKPKVEKKVKKEKK